MRNFNLEKAISKNQVVVVDSALQFHNTVSWNRAISLVVTDEANILIPRSDGSMIRSKYLSIPRPLVVSLNRYVPTRKFKTVGMDANASRSAILVRDNWICAYCDKYGDTIDHIVPKSRGGLNTWGNLCVSCHPCNEQKANHTPQEMDWDVPEISENVTHHRKEQIQNAIYVILKSEVA